MSPPGWYPDPWAQGALRWWSGRDWTAYTAPGPAHYATPTRPTDGFAIASLVTSVIGLSPVGIVLGFVSRRRIRRSGGRLGGQGLATAGIAVGCVLLVMTGVVATLAVNGVFDQVNRDDYAGDEAQVAEVIDRFEVAYEDADGARICRDLFTPELARTYGSDGACEADWDAGTAGLAEIDIQSLYLAGDGATVLADEEGTRNHWTFYLDRYPGQGWRISGLE